MKEENLVQKYEIGNEDVGFVNREAALFNNLWYC